MASGFSWFVAQPDIDLIWARLGDEAFVEWWDQLGQVIRTWAKALKVSVPEEAAEVPA